MHSRRKTNRQKMQQQQTSFFQGRVSDTVNYIASQKTTATPSATVSSATSFCTGNKSAESDGVPNPKRLKQTSLFGKKEDKEALVVV